MFKSLFNIAADIVEIGVSAVKVVAEPVLDFTEVICDDALELAEDIVDGIKSTFD